MTFLTPPEELVPPEPSRIPRLRQVIAGWTRLPSVDILKAVLDIMLDEIEEAPVRSVHEDLTKTPVRKGPSI